MTNFAAIRLIAAFAVVAGHSFVLAGQPAPVLLGAEIHVLAVRVFFVISGYLVLGSWQRDPHVGRFVLRRALRIMPGLVAVVLLAMFVLGPLTTAMPGSYWHSRETWDYLWNLALSPRFALPGVFTDGRAFTAVNGSLWSLPVEAAMYLFLPLYAWHRLVIPPLALAAVGAAIAFTAVWPTHVQPVVYATSIPFSLRFAADFVLGALIASWRFERYLNLQTALLALAAAQCATGHPGVQALLSAFALPYAVLAFCLAPRPVLGWLDDRADLSYGVYLWGVPVQQVAVSVLQGRGGAPGILAFATPLLLLVAAASWRFVERPALGLKPRRRPAGPALVSA